MMYGTRFVWPWLSVAGPEEMGGRYNQRKNVFTRLMMYLVSKPVEPLTNVIEITMFRRQNFQFHFHSKIVTCNAKCVEA